MISNKAVKENYPEIMQITIHWHYYNLFETGIIMQVKYKSQNESVR